MSSVATSHPPIDSNQLALDRTRLAFERTTMAWVRTATSLITFGFSVYKFFHLSTAQAAAAREAADRVIGPREFALMMIGIGILSLLIATAQHVQSMREMRRQAPAMNIPHSLAVLVGALMSVLGVLAFVAVILRR
jgi:putative membrane protein